MARINWIKSWRKPKRLLGVDIGATSVKLIELEKTTAGCLVVAQAIAPLPLGTVSQREIKDPLAVTMAIRQVLAEQPFQTQEAILALPDSLVINKTLQIEAGLNEKQIMAQLMEQAQHNMAYSLDEIYFDFEADQQEVQLVATRKQHVITRTSLATASGLKIVAVEVESHAIARWYAMLLAKALPVGSDQVIAIVDIGATTLLLTVVRHQTIIFTRYDIFAIPYQAEQDEIMLLIRRSLQFFQAQMSQPLAGLIITGGGAILADLAARLEQQFSLPIFAADTLTQLAPCMALSYGLALRVLSL